MSGHVFRELRLPAGLETKPAASWLRSLSARGRASWLSPVPPAVFELRATSSGARWYVAFPDREAAVLSPSLERWLPGAALLDTEPPTHAEARLVVELRLRSRLRPLAAELQPEITRGLLDALSVLDPGERVALQWVVGGHLSRRSVSSPTRQQQSRTGSWLKGPPTLVDSESTAQARRKLDDQLFACAGRIAVAAATAQRRRQLASVVLGAYQVLRVPGAGLSRRHAPNFWATRGFRRYKVNQVDPPCPLRVDELVAVLGWPVGLQPDAVLAGTSLNRSRLLRPDPSVLRTETDPLGRTVALSGYPSSPGQLVLSPQAALRHLWVLGPTGVGKSTVLANLILGDITAGHGVVVVDPKGDLVDDVLSRLPRQNLARVAVLDPTDRAPLGLNVLDSAVGSAVAVDGVLNVLHSLWAGSWGPRLNDILHAGLLTLTIEPGHSLVELPLLLTDPNFRRSLVARASHADPIGLGGFWAWFDQMTPDQAANALAPVMNKLRAFVLRPDLRAVLGQVKPRFTLSNVFNQRHALLVRLPKGEIGTEGAALLGSLVVHQLWQTTQARSAIGAESRRPVFVYLDEFQDVMRLPLDLADALAQARGLGVGLVMAHQHLGQLDKGLRAGVLANAGSRLTFRLDHDDATVLAKRSGGRLDAVDYSQLPAFGAYADLIGNDRPTGPASAITRPLGPPLRPAGQVRVENQQRWGQSRHATEERLTGLIRPPNQVVGREVRASDFGVIDPDEEPS